MVENIDRRIFLKQFAKGASLVALSNIPFLGRCTTQDGLEHTLQPTSTPRPQTRQPDYLELEYNAVQSAFVPMDYPNIISAIDPKYKDKLILYHFEEPEQASQLIPNFSAKIVGEKEYNRQGTTIGDTTPAGISLAYLKFASFAENPDYRASLNSRGSAYEIMPRNLEDPYSIIAREYILDSVKIALTTYNDASMQHSNSFSIGIRNIPAHWDEKTIHWGDPKTSPHWGRDEYGFYVRAADAENGPFHENGPNTRIVFNFSNDAFEVIDGWIPTTISGHLSPPDYGVIIGIGTSTPPTFRTFYSTRAPNPSNYPKLLVGFKARD
mgnify:CR=1 FL=1